MRQSSRKSQNQASNTPSQLAHYVPARLAAAANAKQEHKQEISGYIYIYSFGVCKAKKVAGKGSKAVNKKKTQIRRLECIRDQ